MIEVKTCTKCEEELPMEEFNADKRRKDGKRASCKACDAIQKKKIRENNLEEYRQRNRDANRAYRERQKKEVDEEEQDQG
tara:strand:+ start:18518 stop:18757 length:240 start_codon:yes stop_codon:yes gene_type:complete